MLHILIKRDVNWTMRVNWRRLFWAPRRVLHMMVLVSRYKYHHNIDQECGRAPLYKTASRYDGYGIDYIHTIKEYLGNLFAKTESNWYGIFIGQCSRIRCGPPIAKFRRRPICEIPSLTQLWMLMGQMLFWFWLFLLHFFKPIWRNRYDSAIRNFSYAAQQVCESENPTNHIYAPIWMVGRPILLGSE